jgi:hypothetical protein
MQKSSSKLHVRPSLARAVLAPALACLLLGAAAPWLTAQTITDNFNTDGGIAPGTNLPSGWTAYLLPNSYYDGSQNVIDYAGFQITIGEDTYYGQGTFSYPTNPASAGNYAFRITCPTITNDPVGLLYSRAGAFRQDANYTGRFSAALDMVNWNNTWDAEAMGLAFYANVDNPLNPSTYAIGWGPGLAGLGIVLLKVSGDYPDLVASYGIIGQATAQGGAVLNTSHKYRFTASSHDGTNFMVQLFDLLQPNSPWQSAITTDTNLTGGYTGMLVANTQNVGPAMTQAGDATFDNFYSTVPAAGAMPATVTDLSPPPAGKVNAFYPTVSVGIYNRDTSVNTSTIGLYMDGQPLTSGVNISNYVYKPHNADNNGPNGEIYPTNFPGATVTYSNATLLPWGSVHTNTVVFRDSANTWFTNSWSWTITYPYLFTSNNLPLGSLSLRGFDVRTVQSDNGGATLDNSLDRALQQLAIPPQIPIDRSATSIVQVLNWNKESAPPNNVPGLCQGTQAGSINIAVQSLAYLELTAGLHRFRINSDDRAGLYSGVNLADPNAQILWENPSSSPTASTTFDFVVQADGLYPVRSIWEETGGGAVHYLYSVDLNGVLPDVLVNDPANPAGVVKAYYPIVCKSSSSPTGAYSVASTAVNVLSTNDIVGSLCSPTVVGQMVTGGTLTIPIPSSKQFYRLDGPRKTRITSITKSGTNLVINYQVY